MRRYFARDKATRAVVSPPRRSFRFCRAARGRDRKGRKEAFLRRFLTPAPRRHRQVATYSASPGRNTVRLAVTAGTWVSRRDRDINPMSGHAIKCHSVAIVPVRARKRRGRQRSPTTIRLVHPRKGRRASSSCRISSSWSCQMPRVRDVFIGMFLLDGARGLNEVRIIAGSSDGRIFRDPADKNFVAMQRSCLMI